MRYRWGSGILTAVILLASTPDGHAQGIQFGTTFSRQQCEYLDLDWKQAYEAILELPFDIIRLGAYWSDIERIKDHYDFSELDWQIDQARSADKTIVLVVGMKAPRWPEYFIPAWILKNTHLRWGSTVSTNDYLQRRTLKFIEEVVRRYRKNPAIRYWQVENEALNRFGGRHWKIHKGFLKKEIALVKRLDDERKRPVILTTASYPNTLSNFMSRLLTPGDPLDDNLRLGDVLGINVYPTVGQKWGRRSWYVVTTQKRRLSHFRKLMKRARRKGKEVWVTELQAEPWEPGLLVHRGKERPPTGWPEHTQMTLKELKSLGYTTFLFWGAEYWYDQKMRFDNPQWWDTVGQILREHKNL